MYIRTQRALAVGVAGYNKGGISIKQGIIFESLDEVYDYYDEVVKIVNIKQFLFYCSICRVQPDWIDKSIYDGRIVAYYGRERTKECWERWKNYETQQEVSHD